MKNITEQSIRKIIKGGVFHTARIAAELEVSEERLLSMAKGDVEVSEALAYARTCAKASILRRMEEGDAEPGLASRLMNEARVAGLVGVVRDVGGDETEDEALESMRRKHGVLTGDVVRGGVVGGGGMASLLSGLGGGVDGE